MARVTPIEVRQIVDSKSTIDMQPFIDAASALISSLQSTCDINSLGECSLKEVEKFLAAHFYAVRHQRYKAKRTGDASGTFQGNTDMYFESTHYGQSALMLDTSGCLLELQRNLKDKPKKARVFWAGKYLDSPRPDNRGAELP